MCWDSAQYARTLLVADSEKETPETVSSYNETKYGVAILDQMAKKYTCKNRTWRWPINSVQNTLDLAAINPWVLYKQITNENISCREFIHTLAEDLAGPKVQKQNYIPDQTSLTISKENEGQKNVKWRFCAKENTLLKCVLHVNSL